ncbi:MAG TPA: DUF1707 and DUF4870 domain-containing protein [Kribbellaceae bacterium]
MGTETLLVTPAQRDRAVEILKEMYADGRLTHFELDERLGKALSATTRAELNAAFDGLLARPVPTYVPVAFSRPVQRRQSSGRGLSTLAHWSGYPAFVVGPAVFAATAGRHNPVVRRNAIEALNFQLTTLGVFMGLGFLAALTHGFTWFLFPLVGITWFVLTGIAGLATMVGNDFRYPFAVRLLR